MIRNLGRVLSVLATAEASEIAMHADVSAWGAPSECHRDVSRGEEQRFREARRHAEALARRPMRIIKQEARRRGCPFGSPRYDALVGRIAHSMFPY